MFVFAGLALVAVKGVVRLTDRVKRDSPLSEIALVLVRLDHVA